MPSCKGINKKKKKGSVGPFPMLVQAFARKGTNDAERRHKEESRFSEKREPKETLQPFYSHEAEFWGDEP